MSDWDDKYIRKARLVRVIDGDTVDAIVDLGFRMYHRTRFRLKGINAPEMRGPERVNGELSKKHLAKLLEGHAYFLVKSTKPGKYGGRWIGEIHTPDGVDVQRRMMLDGFAEPY